MGSILEQAVKDKAFPGAVWKVYQGNQLLIEEKVGTLTYESNEEVSFNTRYDLASVTKPFVSFATLLLADRGLISLHDPASYYLKELDTVEKSKITISQLLLHTAGLVSDPELHKIYSDDKSLYKIIFSHPLKCRPNEKVLYTSIGYMYLGYIIERVTHMKLNEFLKKEIFYPLGLNVIDYLPKDKTGIAPTEFSEFRQRMLIGEVHDDNCYVLGGVGGHTGLFSDIEDVCTFGKMLVNGNQDLLSNEMMAGLFTNLTTGLNKGRSYAFFINDPEFGEWDTDHFSHTGFTGTSIFIVPKKRIVSVLLTNRVYPTRDNQKIQQVRNQLHIWLKKEYFDDGIIKN